MTAIAPPAAPASAPPAPAPAAPDEPFWDAEPGTEIPRPPLFLVVIGEPGLGKTHVGMTFPGPVVVFDTEFRADGVLSKFRNIEKYWKKVDAWDDVRQGVGRALQRHAKMPGTFVFDSGSDLNLLAEAEVLAEIAADSKKAHKTLHWGPVNKRFKGLFSTLRDRRWNAVFTARLKDEWKGDDRTGGRTAGSFVGDKLIYHADFAIKLERAADGKRVGRVLKNGAKKIGTYREILEDHELNFAGIAREMDAEPVVTIVAAAPPAIVPAPAPAAPAPVAAPVAAHAPPPNPVQAEGVSAGATPVTPSATPAPPLATSATSATGDDGAGLLAEPFLASLGFAKTGKVVEDLTLDTAAALGSEWAKARDAGMVHVAKEKAEALARGGWWRAPEQKHAAPAPAVVPAVVVPVPAIPTAPPELVAELEALAVELGSTRDGLWKRMTAKGAVPEPGKLKLDAATEARRLMLDAKAAKAAPAKAA